MDQLKQAVAAAFDNVIASGAIEQAIEKKIGETVTSIIEQQLRSYSDFGKALESKVASLIDINLNEIDLPSYRDLVGKVIQQRVGAAMSAQFTEQLGKDLDDLLSPAPAEITLEQLLKEFVEQQMDAYDADEYRGRDFSLYISRSDSNDGYVDVYFDKDGRKSMYSCDFQLRTKNGGEVWGLRVDGVDPKKQLFLGPMFGFEKRLVQLYTARTKLVIPPNAEADDFDASFPENGDDY